MKMGMTGAVTAINWSYNTMYGRFENRIRLLLHIVLMADRESLYWTPLLKQPAIENKRMDYDCLLL